jgi:hypothetical protein
MRPLLPLAVAVLVLLAGCAQAPAKATASRDEENGAGAGPSVGFHDVNTTAATGGVSGVVVDEAIRPLAGANVTLDQAQKTVVTDAEGLFTFEGLAPGAFTLRVTAAGHMPVLQTVTVEAGTVTKVKVVLLTTSAKDSPYHVSYAWRGFMDVYAGLASWTLEVEGDSVSNQTLCQCTFYVTVDEQPKQFVYEGVWSDSVPDASGLGWYWEFTDRAESVVQSDFSKSPMYAVLEASDFPADNLDYTARLTGPWAGVEFQQKYDLYLTVFYRDFAPKGWSLVNGDV